VNIITVPGPTGTPVLLTWGTDITNNSNEFVDALTEPLAAWTAYTPTWVSTGSQPALGTGTISGRYMRFGKVGFVNFILTSGASTTYGTGIYTFGLPAGWTAAGAVGTVVGTGRVFDTSTSTRYIGDVEITTGNTAVSMGTHSTITEVSGTVPVTLASGDIIKWCAVIELT
jgi:hypothetical protein